MFSLDVLPGPYNRLLWGTLAILVAIVVGHALKWYVHRLGERRPAGERELERLRRRETAGVLVATAVPYATAIVVVVVIADLFLPLGTAALGGTAFASVIIGVAAQRFLMDIVAGTLIVFERWYAVGDFVMVEPAKASGVVEQFSLRTTVLRSTPHVVEERELGEGAWLVRGQADVTPTMEWLAEGYLVEELKTRLHDALLAEPIVYTIDEGALSRYGGACSSGKTAASDLS